MMRYAVTVLSTLLVLLNCAIAQPMSGSQVNVRQINGVSPSMGNGASGTGVQRVTLASDSTGQVTCNAGTNLNTSTLATSANQSTMITSLQLLDDVVLSGGSAVTIATQPVAMLGARNSAGNASVVQMTSDNSTIAVSSAGTTLKSAALSYLYNGSAWAQMPGDATNGLDVDITRTSASTTGGYTNYSFGALVGTVQTVKSGAATLGGYYILNSAATICYLQIFDNNGAITLGTTVPDLSIGLPAGAAANIPPVSPGAAFSNAIKIAATTTRAGSTPCGTGMDVNIWYK